MGGQRNRFILPKNPVSLGVWVLEPVLAQWIQPCSPGPGGRVLKWPCRARDGDDEATSGLWMWTCHRTDIERECSATRGSWLREVTAWSPPSHLPGQRVWESCLVTPPLWPHLHVGFHLLQGNVEVFVINYREKKRGWWRGGDRNCMTQEGSVRNCSFLGSHGTCSLPPDTCLLWLRRSTCPQCRKALSPGSKTHPLGNPGSPVWKKSLCCLHPRSQTISCPGSGT